MISNATRLRTLTKLSQLKFGRNKNDTVQQTLDLGAVGRSRLAWYYFLMSNISFSDDVLDELGITEELRIEKPTTNKRLFNEWETTLSIMDERAVQIHVTKLRRSKEWAKKASRRSSNSKDRLGFSKSGLADKNRGH
tara:strand:+ start:101 stop:511 length:411 start_codon:yes stop_codon:yes gene_type:complete